MNILYQGLDSLDVLEQLPDKKYDFIYLDLPFNTGFQDYLNNFLNANNVKSIRQYISKSQNIPMNQISPLDVKKERRVLEQKEFKEYSNYVSKIMENVYRLLNDDGILACLSPLQDYSGINYKLVLDQFFHSITNVTLKHPKSFQTNKSISYNRDFLLYFCSKIHNFEFPVLMELPPENRFNECDDHGPFIKKSAYSNARYSSFQYEWQGITPSNGKSWRYTKDKMNELFSENRIVILDNDHVFIKFYRDEHLVPISTTWEYVDSTKLYSSPLCSQSIERMFSMFVKPESNILCPFDRDGKFSWVADNDSINWTSICPPNFPNKHELFSAISKENYVIINNLEKHEKPTYQSSLVTGINDINELKEIASQITKIQSLVGASSPEEAIDEIHQLINTNISDSNLKVSLTEAKEWLYPYWDKLEPESQHFIPMGLTLYNQFINMPDADMAASMIEYCKCLEGELFKKLFSGYILDLKTRNINIKEQFSDAFEKDETKIFADFIIRCLGKSNRNRPNRWQFEIGKMVYVLKHVLSDNLSEPIFIDFRNYLDRIFGQNFFRLNFCDQLDRIITLRNNCAHPHLIDNTSASEGRNIIKEKLMSILEYYEE